MPCDAYRHSDFSIQYLHLFCRYPASLKSWNRISNRISQYLITQTSHFLSSGVGGLFVSKAGTLGSPQKRWVVGPLKPKASNFKHLGNSKITSSTQLPPPKRLCDESMPCRKWSEDIRGYFDILILLLVVQILQVCPLELSLKSRQSQGGWEVAELMRREKWITWTRFHFFCGGISGGKKKLFFTSTSTVCFLKAEVQQLSHGWLLFPWDRRRCGVQWPSIIWQGKWGNIAPQGLILTANEWTQWRFFSSAMEKNASLSWCCVASAISIVFGAWLGSSLDQLGMSMFLQAFCVVASVLGHVLHCFPVFIFYLRVSWCQMDFYPFLHP